MEAMDAFSCSDDSGGEDLAVGQLVSMRPGSTVTQQAHQAGLGSPVVPFTLSFAVLGSLIKQPTLNPKP